MIKIKVFTKEDIEGGYNGTELSYLRPRRYMTGWSFEQLMKYTAEERKWQLFQENDEDVQGFEIFDKKEHWTIYIPRE